MLNVTKALRDHATKNLGVSVDASDDDIRLAVGAAIVKGTITLERVSELCKPDPTGDERMLGLVDAQIQKALAPLTELVTKALGNVAAPAAAPASPAPATTETKTLNTGDTVQKALIQGAGTGEGAGATTSESPQQIRIKAAIERYHHAPTAATYDKSDNLVTKTLLAGRQVMSGNPGWNDIPGRGLDMPTQRTKAIAGVWFKHLITKSCRAEGRQVPAPFRLNEHEQDLVQWVAHNCKFVGPIGHNDSSGEAEYWFKGQKAERDYHIKALLDDSTSGGLEAVPIEFDDAAILTPLLHGELFPFVDVRNVSRRRIEGFSMRNPTMSWSYAEGTSIGLFDTSAFIAAFDNSIYPITGAMELGLDFQSDSPVENLGEMVVQRYGQSYRKQLDDVIANGNGTTQPQGLFQASSITTVVPAAGSGNAPLLDDFEALLAGIPKEFRAEAGPGQVVFLSTDTSYWRSRAIKVGTSDARRLFGMSHENYQTMGHAHKINSNITNAQTGAWCLNRYRMYRRAGFDVRIVTNDSELARKNQQLVVVRARFGGALDHSSAGCKITAGQA